MENNNGVAQTCKTSSILLGICGFIGGIVIGNILKTAPKEIYEDPQFNIGLAFTIWVSTFITCLLFFAIGEIIRLLQNNLNASSTLISQSYTLNEMIEKQKNGTLTEACIQKKEALDTIEKVNEEPFTWVCSKCAELNLTSKGNICKKCNPNN